MLIMNLGSDGNTYAAQHAYVTVVLQEQYKLGCCLCSEVVLAECKDCSRNRLMAVSRKRSHLSRL